MNSVELARLGIILTMTSFLFISPEVFNRARELAWVDSIFKSIKSLVLNIKSRTVDQIKGTHKLEVKQQLEQALKTGRPTKLLFKGTLVSLIPLASFIGLVLYFHGSLHISVGIIAGILALPVVFVSIVDVFVAHSSDVKMGKRVSFLTNLVEHFMLPPMIYLYLCTRGIIWPITIVFILLSPKSVRSWLAVMGIAMFITGLVLQLIATFN